jgi:hypothetical protein
MDEAVREPPRHTSPGLMPLTPTESIDPAPSTGRADALLMLLQRTLVSDPTLPPWLLLLLLWPAVCAECVYQLDEERSRLAA